ncbi:MAG TPA: hypothetical protein PK509_08160 [Catalimonadaceae bacterium]|nr:hypothetical protein [Catalimonadaceae bacterium]HPI09795.1 hypothetical protein [Catalimonadaceae bacterium]
MIPSIRKQFNQQFTDQKYKAFLEELFTRFGHEIEFRIAETPVFIPKDLKKRLFEACDHIIDVILQPDFMVNTERAIPEGKNVPFEDKHAQFLAIDFAICEDANGRLTPQLIEMQGFPSLFAFQDVISETFRRHYACPPDFDYLFSGLTSEKYRKLLGQVILNGHKPENVILMDIEPQLQKTKVDFMAVKDFFAVPSVCISKLKKNGRKLYYEANGHDIEVKRIYNRVIFDELDKRTDLNLQFHMNDDVDVEWAGHPNWFFRISKFSMPLLHSPYVPETKYLSDYKGNFPTDLENYVLKPLFSFAGTGVIYDVKPEDVTTIQDPENYILQKKIYYAPALKAPDGEGVKTEIRMLYLWPYGEPRPIACTNLIRFSKGVMMGVKFNHNKTWVGGSTAFFEPETN